MTLSHRFLVLASCVLLVCSAAATATVSIAITMICRNEKVNFSANLALWMPIMDYFVFMMDSRNSDNSKEVIASILGSHKSYKIIDHEFVGFGQARTASLDAVWKYYPEATHVLIADPDWRPDVSTMRKADLSADFDVYRFTAFDRNGFTRRQMDWLLRNKEGLRMRYHLHEVLDIGHYRMTSIPWVVHEIEKPGTWHSLIGHGSSFGLKRYMFDLEMLEKDVPVYGHDPHTHYYLGVTHHAIVEKEGANVAAGKPSKDIDYNRHLQETIKYLELRSTTTYDDEFDDERWAAMYLLGSTYTTYMRDYIKAEYWLSMCRDFNRDNIECGMSLVRLHLNHGMLAAAFAELEIVLRTNRKRRQFIEHFREWDCDLPQLTITVLTHVLSAKATTYTQMLVASGMQATGVNTNPNIETLRIEGKRIASYMLMLEQMVNRPQCMGAKSDRLTFDPVGQAAIEAFVPNLSRSKTYNPSTLMAMCSDTDMQSFLVSTRYRLHPCDQLSREIEGSEICSDFTQDLQPPSMEYHLRSYKEFIGAASIPDIVHHVYKGRAKRLYGRRMQILFAEFFNIRNLYFLLGFLLRNKSFKADITVVTQDSDMIARAQQIIKGCIPDQDVSYTITYLQTDLAKFLTQLQRRNVVQSAQTKRLFDYIEYNGGLSVSSHAFLHLQLMNAALSPDGTIGITAFGANRHQEAIFQLVSNRNKTAHRPFSEEGERIVRAYLEANDFEDVAKDDELVNFLAGVGTAQGRDAMALYRPHEIEEVLIVEGLKVASWVPAMYCHPYIEMSQVSVLQYKSMGISEDAFTYTLMPNFRYTVYASKASSNLPGRLVGSEDDLTTSMAETIVLDRVGSLSESFKNIARFAAADMSSILFFSPAYATHLNITHAVLPHVSPALAMISDRPTLQLLHQTNLDLQQKFLRREVDAVLMLGDLVRMLALMERMQMVTFWISDEGLGHANDADVVRSSAVAATRIVGEAVPKQAASSSTGTVNVNQADEVDPKASSTSERPPQPAANVKGTAENGASTGTEHATSKKKKLSAEALEKGRRLREMGFPEHLVEEALARYEMAADEAEPDAGTDGDIDEKTSHASSTVSRPFRSTASTGQHLSDSKDGIADTSPSGDAEMQAKVQRMRDMGFPENVIETAIARDKAKRAEEKNINTLNGVSSENRAAATTTSGTASHDVDKRTSVTSKAHTEPSSTFSKASDEKIQKLESEKSSLSGRLQDVKNMIFRSGKSKDVLSDIPAEQIAEAILDDIAAQSRSAAKEDTPTAPTLGITHFSKEGSYLLDKAKDIQLPKRQMVSQLESSPRHVKCIKPLAEVQQTAACREAQPRKRRTAGLMLTSMRKAQFDMYQIQYFMAVLESKASTRGQAEGLKQWYIRLQEQVSRIKKHTTPKTQEQIFPIYERCVPESGSVMNRPLHLDTEVRLDPEELAHEGALRQLTLAAEGFQKMEHDFAVFDVILQNRAMQALSNLLLRSSVWFDAGNGMSFASHYDDGLVFDGFADLAQLLAASLSTDSRTLRVSKYYALTLFPESDTYSPVILGEGQELTAVLWLNPQQTAADPKDSKDGLRIYNRHTANAMFGKSISKYTSVHSDFLSAGGSLNIDIDSKLDGTASEYIRRVNNRLVLVGARNPLLLTATGSQEDVKKLEDDPLHFGSMMTIAFVVVMSPE